MRIALFCSLSLVALTACTSARPLSAPSVWPEAIASETPEVKLPSRTEGIRAGSVSVSDEICRICTIRAQVGSAPRFAFDSDEIGSPEKHILGLVARCFTSGPLRGRALKVTGHTDPRGEGEYNLTLGAARATNVKSYLGTRGMDPRKISDTSRGELDASGDEEGSWARDRRVDVDLIK